MDFLADRFEREVFQPYIELLKSEYRFHPKFEHAERAWTAQTSNMSMLVRGPFLEQSQIYEVGELIENLDLQEATKRTVDERLKGRLYSHQTKALKLILDKKNAVIATGTSSGKTLCYQIPILDDLIKDTSPGLRAIIIYPLNALVNDQLTEWEKMLKAYPQITFARFTGQTPNDQDHYEMTLRMMFEQELLEDGKKASELESEINRRLKEQLADDKNIQNRFNHRQKIREKSPNILITNFSMLEYLMERPIDAPIFDGANLRFIVLDEVHAYRGVQATEVAFLIRRLKDRLRLENLSCIATSATLGDKNDTNSMQKVREFATKLFGEPFDEPNPVYGDPAEPELREPQFCPSPAQYISAVGFLRNDQTEMAQEALSPGFHAEDFSEYLLHDSNLHQLKAGILIRPTLLRDAANELWGGDEHADEGLQALLEIVNWANMNGSQDDILPTRLHYFVKTMDGLHACLHPNCPARLDESNPAFFASRQDETGNTITGLCPSCSAVGRTSKLVEVLSCRKCGYLFGALQDLGPRKAQNKTENADEKEPDFNDFDTELGWASDSYWSYFSIESEFPYPKDLQAEEDDDDFEDWLRKPITLNWCVICGKKRDGNGEVCSCPKPQLREIQIFHRQCENLYEEGKKLLNVCPNCGSRNGSGYEPFRRFQESDDENGLAMAIPLAHFQVGVLSEDEKPKRKLLCFTDHRQRAAAFPSLIEEETFTHDLGRKIVEIISRKSKPIEIKELGEELAEIADSNSDIYDSSFFLPVTRFPDKESIDNTEKRRLWQAEVFSYFGIQDSARESAEDLGLIRIAYELKESDKNRIKGLFPQLSDDESVAAMQILFGLMRREKAFTLPIGVQPDLPAFGSVTPEIGFGLRKDGKRNRRGWLPRLKNDGTYNDNKITDYLGVCRDNLFDFRLKEIEDGL